MQKASSFRIDHIWCVVPVFNNKDTVRDVAFGCRKYLNNVVVVDDGSTDADLTQIFRGSDIIVLKHEKNKGKGQAIRTALKYISSRQGCFMITIDADGQHSPCDLEKFIPLLQEDNARIIIGSRDFDTSYVPGKSNFGRNLANFWLRVESGVLVDDCQSGFRAYPIRYLNRIRLRGARYDFETEILAKAAWAGLELKTVPVTTSYAPKEKRISHYRPFLDTLRISLMHAKLVARRLLPFPHKRLVVKGNKYFDSQIFRHPVLFFKKLLKEDVSPLGLAFAAAAGIFLGVLPLISFHTLVIIYVATRLHLNKIMAVTIQHICVPPFIPIVCIEIGHYMLYGKWIQEVSPEVVFGQLKDRLFEWFLGALILAPVLSVLIGMIVFFITRKLQKKTYAG